MVRVVDPPDATGERMVSQQGPLSGYVILVLLAMGASAAAGDLRLVEAVKQQNTAAVRGLLQQGLDVNAPQPDGATALHWAAHWADLDTAELLIRAGARVNAVSDLGVTPLYLAAANGSASMVETLLGAGANPNVPLSTGETVVMAAARTGSVPSVTALLARGANVNAKEKRRDQTALMWAVAHGHAEVVRALIEHGADLHARSRVMRVRINTGGPFNNDGRTVNPGVLEAEQGGFTALLFAARHGDVVSATILLDAGADVNDAAADGTSALVVAAHSNQAPVARLLLDRGADPNAAGAGYTALHAAVLRDNLPLARALVGQGADPNVPLTKGTQGTRFSCNFTLPRGLIGSTPFHLAARFAEPEMMRVLAAAGADPLRALDDGTTPLMLVVGVRSGTGDRRQRPLPRDGQVACADDPQDSAREAREALELAVELGGNVNAANSAGDTALHAAAAKGFNAGIQFLVERSARLDAKNKAGQTPLAVASRRGRDGGESTADLLRRLGATE